MRFGDPECGCSCRVSRWAQADLAPGHATELIVLTAPKPSVEPTVFTCRWSDEAGQYWSSQSRVQFLLDQLFVQPQVQYASVRPATTLRHQIDYVQHAATPSALMPVPRFVPSDERLKVLSRAEKTECLTQHFSQRTVTLEVELQTGLSPGLQSALIRTDHGTGPTVPSVGFEWRVQELVHSEPANLVLSHADFEAEPVVRRVFLVRAAGGPVRVLSASVQGAVADFVRVSVRNQAAPSPAGSVLDVESRRPAATRNGSILVTTDVAECPQVVIPIAYIAEPAG